MTIVATGGEELKPKEYLYGEDKRVLTQLEMEGFLHGDGRKIEELKEVVMIQCVGSRNEERPYCSRVCCAEAVKNALTLKALNPKARVTILYRDMRMYGTLEEDYARARKAGIRFLRYEEERKPEVTPKGRAAGGYLLQPRSAGEPDSSSPTSWSFPRPPSRRTRRSWPACSRCRARPTASSWKRT